MLFLLSVAFLCCQNAWAYPLPDTGQTRCYDNETQIPCPEPGEPFYGQDGNYLINPPSYTKLDASGNDLPDTATEWVMVRDNVTKLVWEVKTDDMTMPISIHYVYNMYNWQDAQDVFVAQVNAENFGGHSDWRLPTIQELSSITNLGPFLPAVSGTYFPFKQWPMCWSSTTSDTDTAWYVNFASNSRFKGTKSSSYYVRAVRGGQAEALDHFVINGDGTVTDTNTGLMWQQATMKSKMTWEDALAACEWLTLGGYYDWRLPSQRELNSIIDFNEYDPAINQTAFPNTMSYYYWSSSTQQMQTPYAWYVNFTTGEETGSFPLPTKMSTWFVRAVRGGKPPDMCPPDIKANGSDGPITLSSSESVSIDISLDPGDELGLNAEWWIVVQWQVAGQFWYNYSYVHPDGWSPGITPCIVTPLMNLGSTNLLTTTLPPNNYEFFFVLDDKIDGKPEIKWMDSVKVIVQ